MKLTIKYQRDSEQLRAQAREHFLATGQKLAWSSDREIEIDLEKITREQRELIDEYSISRDLPSALELTDFRIGEQFNNVSKDEDRYYLYFPEANQALRYDHDLSESEIFAELDKLVEEKRKLTAEGAEATAADKQRRAEELKRDAEKEARKEAEEEAYAADRAAWIGKHGSEHLKRACDAGHTCSRLYLTERAAKEYPGALLDFDDHADWNPRSCPSLAALDLRDKLLKKHPDAEIKIVWLTNFPLNEERKDEEALAEREEEFEAHEAITVRDPAIARDLIIEIEERKK